MLYTQVKLRNGPMSTVKYIPARYAKKGDILTVRNDPGWVVEEVFGQKDEQFLRHLRSTQILFDSKIKR